MNGEGVSVEEMGGVFHATTEAGKYRVSVVHDPRAYLQTTEVAFLKGEKVMEIIKLDAKSLGDDAETIKSSLEEAALRFGDLIRRGFSPAQIQEEMINEKMNKV